MKKNRGRSLFHWRGIDADDLMCSGWAISCDHEDLGRHLADSGITLTRARKRPCPSFRTVDAYRFLEQITTLLKAGMPILDALELAKQDRSSRRLQAILSSITEHLKSGSPLSDSTAPFIKSKDRVILQAMILGEKSGRFDEVLERLLKQRKKTVQMQSKLLRAAIYPLVLTFISAAVVVLMMVWAVPQFKSIYADFGAGLPAYTLRLIAISEFLAAEGLALMGWTTAIVFGVVIPGRTSKMCRRTLAKAQLHLPLIGPLLRIRFYRQFAADINLIYRSGMPLGEALNWLPQTNSHPCYRTALKQVCENVSYGLSLNESLANSGFFPPFVIHAVRIGENSGSLDQAFERIENFYDAKLASAADKIVKLFEPLLVTVLSLIVGSLLIAMYLPMFNLGFVL